MDTDLESSSVTSELMSSEFVFSQNDDDSDD